MSHIKEFWLQNVLTNATKLCRALEAAGNAPAAAVFVPAQPKNEITEVWMVEPALAGELEDLGERIVNVAGTLCWGRHNPGKIKPWHDPQIRLAYRRCI